MRDLFPYPRRRDWTIRWVEFMKDSQDLAAELVLDWEDLNCIMWCCQWIESCTGYDPYEPFVHAKGVKGAVSAIKDAGYETLDQIIGSHLYEVPLAKAQTGDLVLIRADWEAPEAIKTVLPHGIALADPPLYWCITPEGLGKGDLYVNGVKAYAVGRTI